MHKFNDHLIYLDSAGGQCAIDLSKVRLGKTSLGKICLSMYYNTTACIWMNLKYRSLDGSCNNLKRSSTGKQPPLISVCCLITTLIVLMVISLL